MLNKINIARLFAFFAFLPLAIVSGCTAQDLALHRLNEMKPTAYFDTEPQIDLANAITKGDTNKIQALIAAGANVNYSGNDGMKPLFWAMAKQNIQAFNFLLDNGADPNAIAATQHSSQGNALTLAAIYDDSRYLQSLVAHGANPNAPVGNTRETAIFFAASNHRTNNISILLKHGADIDWKTANDNTPLHQSVYEGSYEMALFLYQAGANPLIKNKLGYNPVETMKQFGDNGGLSHDDEKAYKQLLEKFRKAGLLDKPSQPNSK